jgi:Amt family ammonium transporter
MVRQKNVLGTIMHSFIILGLITVEWVLWGYSNAFGPSLNGIIGSLDWFGLAGVGPAPFKEYAATIPHQAFMIFQMMFAIITPALITGTFAERMKFSTFLVFTLLWATLVYNPVAHWVWGIGGWLRDLGALDFAGGPWSTSIPGSPPWRPPWSLENERATAMNPFTPTTCP